MLVSRTGWNQMQRQMQTVCRATLASKGGDYTQSAEFESHIDSLRFGPADSGSDLVSLAPC